MNTLSITLIETINSIIKDEKELTCDNTNKLHNLALNNGLDTSFDSRANTFHIVNSDGIELISFYDGFTRLCYDY